MAANRLAQWVLMLNKYKYTIEYRKTTDHGNADALSHLQAGKDPIFDKEAEEGKGTMILTISIVDRQFDPDSDPFKPAVLALELKRDSVISTVMRDEKEG